jgi:hypothetical protein
MKGTKILAIAVASALISGCSSTSFNPFGGDKDFTVSQPGENTTAVKDQTVGLINDEGIKIYYSLLGNLKRIEVYGVAPAWKGNVEVLAEADAKSRLVKFLYDEQVNTKNSVDVITRTIDKARDNFLNNVDSGDREVLFDREEIKAEVAQTPNIPGAKENQDNTSRRIAERVEQTTIRELSRITSSGTLRGLRKIGSEVRDDGKIYVAVYEWSEKNQGTANEIRRKMFAK